MEKIISSFMITIFVIFLGLVDSRVINRVGSSSNQVSKYACNFNKMTVDKEGKLIDEASTWKGNIEIDSEEAKLAWKLKKGKTREGELPITGPSEDSDEDSEGTGQYMYLDSSIHGRGADENKGHLKNDNYLARFTSRKFQARCHADGSSCPVNEFSHCLKFNLHMRGLTTGSLTVKLKKENEDEEIIFRAVGEKSGDNRWIYVAVPLVGYAHKEGDNVQLVFEAETSYGLTSDIAVDDIEVTTYGNDGAESCQRWPTSSVDHWPVEPANSKEFPEDRKTCGTTKSHSAGSRNSTDAGSANIFHGTETQRGQWPWMAMIKRKSGDQVCGGTLLGSNAVVTAAHCVFDMEKKDDLYVRLGAYQYEEDEDKGGINYKIKEVYVHPKYNGYSHGNQKSVWFNNDVAVLILDDKQPIIFTDYVQSICLPDSSEQKESCYVAGWGYTSSTKKNPDVLLDGKVAIIGCNSDQANFDAAKGEVISESMMCARGQDTDTCSGDSGGPLMCQMKSGQWSLCGITSWGKRGCQHNTGIYTDVRKEDIHQWIRGVIKNRPSSNRLPFEGHNGYSVSVIQ